MIASLSTLFRQFTKWAVGATIIVGCTVEVPSHIIQPEEMENLLYDYHLMQAMASDLKSSESLARKQYELYVFDKHNVSEAEFDTSLTWYLRHTKELDEIYKKLNRRYSAQKKALAVYLAPEERTDEVSPEGDTVNVWNDFKLIRLSTSALANKLLFTLKTDSNYHLRDSLVWQMNASFMGDTGRTKAVVGMTLFYDKDTVGISKEIVSSGPYAVAVASDSTYQLKQLIGHVYYYPLSANHTGKKKANDLNNYQSTCDLLLSDIALIRYHRPDTVITDSTDVEDLSSITNP